MTTKKVRTKTDTLIVKGKVLRLLVVSSNHLLSNTYQSGGASLDEELLPDLHKNTSHDQPKGPKTFERQANKHEFHEGLFNFR